jgi:uncharacterized membrane protein YccC
MEYCFNHKTVPAAAGCPYCAKHYCADCLLLQGPRQVIICKNCFGIISARIAASSNRRVLYIVVGGIVGILLLVYGLAELFSNNVSSVLFFLVGFGCLLVTAVNMVRRNQIKEFLNVRQYADMQ